ncbi:hypothetical protein DPMN_118302 [Dreissena polymorpha]|uniref:Uncharacterized protein n=1 Tax=Dreissena polymorpha TaxID=45954 RepID=A0A9D4GJX7_DREPO|nr:hypothetical protein DPMN_118302 [Dreissena polymorpha]
MIIYCQFITSEGESDLPAPSIMVESHGKTGLRVQWSLPRRPDPVYDLLLYVVNVVGTRFQSSINSHIRYREDVLSIVEFHLKLQFAF